MSVRQYQSIQTRTDTPRQTEYRLLADITRRLLSIDNLKTPRSVEAVCDNMMAWNTFSADLMMPDNKLPDSLKAQLISISLWVERHSRKVLDGSAKIGALIEVNRAVMAGLAQQPGAAAPVPPVVPAKVAGAVHAA